MNQQPDHTQGSQADRIDHLVDLIMKYKRDCINTDEHQELDKWVVADDSNMHLFEELTNEESMKEAIEWMSATSSTDALKKLKGQLHFERPRRRFSMLTLLLHCTIAASLLFLLTISLVVIDKD